MKPEEFESVTSQILTNLTDQGKVSELLTQLNETYKTTHTTSQTLDDKQKDYEKEIQALKDTNMNLFLKLKSQPETQDQGSGSSDQSEPMTYDKLLDEMGVNK
jgi:hypothetical protein